jgi:hypothetical protein
VECRVWSRRAFDHSIVRTVHCPGRIRVSNVQKSYFQFPSRAVRSATAPSYRRHLSPSAAQPGTLPVCSPASLSWIGRYDFIPAVLPADYCRCAIDLDRIVA